jgi:class 3 adenylate cyclase
VSPGVVTVLFTDLVGSTDLIARLGDEAAEELRQGHSASCAGRWLTPGARR